MNCRQVENQIVDRLAGRLSAEQAAAIDLHVQSCRRCARLAAAERRLRVLWRETPALMATPDLWPVLAQRLRSPAPARRGAFFGSWPFGVAAAAALLVGASLWTWLGPNPRQSPAPMQAVAAVPMTPVADEGRVIGMVAQLQQLPETDSDAMFSETRLHPLNKRDILLGVAER